MSLNSTKTRTKKNALKNKSSYMTEFELFAPKIRFRLPKISLQLPELLLLV